MEQDQRENARKEAEFEGEAAFGVNRSRAIASESMPREWGENGSTNYMSSSKYQTVLRNVNTGNDSQK